MNTEAISLFAALLAGLVGSAHCVAMCGGLAGALGMRARAQGGTRAVLATSLTMQFGRIGSYAIAGALVGGVGAALTLMFDLVQAAQALRVGAGVLLLLVALRVSGGWNVLAPLEKWGARLWRAVAPMTRARGHGFGAALAMGALWGWLPCGLVYSMLLYAALSGSALNGAAILAMFGVGTLPSMLGSGALLGYIVRAQRWRYGRYVAATLIAGCGVWLIAATRYGVHVHAH